ncbi:MAG: serine/threonine-protein kinase [Polyangiaceae bacterium]
MGGRDVLGPLIQLVADGHAADPALLEEAMILLAAVRMTPDEARALERLSALHAQRPLPEPLRVAMASALVDRGESDAAAALVADASSPAALMIRAELLAREGDWLGASSEVERILFRDIDWPGARERRARWAEEGAAPNAANSAPSGSRAVLPPLEGRRSLDKAPFRLVREVARGGAGAVYEADDRELGRRVALKVYHHPDRDRAQLQHEARVAVALAGDGVIAVFDVDLDQGWLAMPWAPLGALGARLKTADPTVLAATPAWSHSLSHALARVHQGGWVHHDVKPANVLLASTDTTILTDFGTARRRGEPSPPGSLGYVSPERQAGRPSDPRDDVFGFGRVLEETIAAASRAPGALAESAARDLLGLAAACVGPDQDRPIDGGELVTLLSRTGG